MASLCIFAWRLSRLFPVNNQRQASGLGGVLVVNGAEREQALVAAVGLRGGGHGAMMLLMLLGLY